MAKRSQKANERMAQFFQAYEARMNRALADPPHVDVEATARAFADCFVEATPKGVTCSTNDDQFRDVIPKGLEFYRSIGTQSMKIASQITTPLDEWHAMVRVDWQASYKRKDGSELQLDFGVIYFVQTINDEPKIFCYITGDEQKAYREKGLMPG